MKRSLLLAFLLWPLASAAWAADQVYLNPAALPSGAPGMPPPKKTLFGQITAISPTKITFSTQEGDSSDIEVNQIDRILFENSPPGMPEAQKCMLTGEYEKAIDALKKESTDDKRPEVAQEILYTRAYCKAQLTFSGDADLKEAGTLLATFIKSYPSNFHYFKACELMGDLCVTADRFDMAADYYGKLKQAPWPDYKMRASVALGRTYLVQENAAAAEKQFDDALSNAGQGALVETQRAAAQIGKARCATLKGDTESAISSLDDIVAKLEDNNTPPEIAAMAYNARGTALRKANKPEKAVLDFLHVHLKYESQQDAHAEALANLEKLFLATHKPDHAKDMRQILDNNYGNSRWARTRLK